MSYFKLKNGGIFILLSRLTPYLQLSWVPFLPKQSPAKCFGINGHKQ